MTQKAVLIDYQDQDQTLEGYFAYDDQNGGPRPTILIAHMWGGRVSFVCEIADKLAELGYAAMALDMYGKGVFGTNKEENAALMTPFMQDRSKVLHRMQLALEAVRQQSQVDMKKIVVSGYCFGGLCALDLARSGADIAGTVSFHGLLQSPQRSQTKTINGKVLVMNGAKDPMVSSEAIINFQTEMADANADWTLINYGNAVHAFTNPEASDEENGMIYDASADARSWQAFLQFLGEVFNK